MTVVPDETPVTIPELVPTVATAVLVLLHVPPVTASLSVVVDPTQMVVVPAMGPGGAVIITVTTMVFSPPIGQPSSRMET